MKTWLRKTVALITAISVATGPASSAFAQASVNRSGSLSPSETEYEACQATNDEDFRKAIEAITWKALSRGLAKIDYNAIVGDEWRKGELNRIIDARVDAAAVEVRTESSWGSLLSSLTSRAAAQELATAVAERVYRSEPVKQAIANLATGVGKQIGESIVLTTTDAAGPAQTCVRLFLGNRYGSTVATAVSNDAGAAFAVDAGKGKAGVKTSSVLLESAGGLTGAAILLVRRQLARMASRLGQRLIGSVLSRLVSVVAGGVGIALIAKDIWDFRHGMLPIIAEEMKAPATKAKVREELAKSIKEQIALQTRQIAKQTAQRILKIWHDFKRAHNKVLALAEEDKSFRDYLDVVGDKNLQKLDEVVALILREGGDPAVKKALASGKLQRAVNALSPEGMRVGRETGSLDKALSWTQLAAERLPSIVEYALHQRTDPATFSRTSLYRLLDLNDRLAIVRLASLPQASRDALFDLTDKELKVLSRALTKAELTGLSGYIGGLKRPVQTLVLKAIAESPGKMQRLTSTSVRDAVIASKDQKYAAEMLLRDNGVFDVDNIWQDTQAAWSGRISPRLMWERHPIVVVALAVAVLLLLLIFRGLFFSGRRRPPAPPSQPAATAA